MIKKLFILLVLIFLVSGCTAEYNLIINDDNTIQEEVTILQLNSLYGSTMNDVNEQLDWSLILSSDEIEPGYFYRKEKIIGSQESGLKYSYDFNYNNFISESESLKTCYDDYSLNVNDENLKLYAHGFKCYTTLGNNYSLNLNITVNGNVIDGNYHKKVNNTYTWNLNKSNSEYIFLNIDRTSIKKNYNILLILIIVGIVGIFGSIILIGYLKNKKSNKL